MAHSPLGVAVDLHPPTHPAHLPSPSPLAHSPPGVAVDLDLHASHHEDESLLHQLWVRGKPLLAPSPHRHRVVGGRLLQSGVGGWVGGEGETKSAGWVGRRAADGWMDGARGARGSQEGSPNPAQQQQHSGCRRSSRPRSGRPAANFQSGHAWVRGKRTKRRQVRWASRLGGAPTCSRLAMVTRDVFWSGPTSYPRILQQAGATQGASADHAAPVAAGKQADGKRTPGGAGNGANAPPASSLCPCSQRPRGGSGGQPGAFVSQQGRPESILAPTECGNHLCSSRNARLSLIRRQGAVAGHVSLASCGGRELGASTASATACTRVLLLHARPPR